MSRPSLCTPSLNVFDGWWREPTGHVLSIHVFFWSLTQTDINHHVHYTAQNEREAADSFPRRSGNKEKKKRKMGIFLWCNRLFLVFCWRSFYNVYVEVSGRLSRGQENCNPPGYSGTLIPFNLSSWLDVNFRFSFRRNIRGQLTVHTQLRNPGRYTVKLWWNLHWVTHLRGAFDTWTACGRWCGRDDLLLSSRVGVVVVAYNEGSARWSGHRCHNHRSSSTTTTRRSWHCYVATLMMVDTIEHGRRTVAAAARFLVLEILNHGSYISLLLLLWSRSRWTASTGRMCTAAAWSHSVIGHQGAVLRRWQFGTRLIFNRKLGHLFVFPKRKDNSQIKIRNF